MPPTPAAHAAPRSPEAWSWFQASVRISLGPRTDRYFRRITPVRAGLSKPRARVEPLAGLQHLRAGQRVPGKCLRQDWAARRGLERRQQLVPAHCTHEPAAVPVVESDRESTSPRRFTSVKPGLGRIRSDPAPQPPSLKRPSENHLDRRILAITARMSSKTRAPAARKPAGPVRRRDEAGRSVRTT